MQQPKVVILCGGFGTRIREASEIIPKPMLQIGERPILWHIMKGYAAHGFTDFVLCLGYRGASIKQFFLNYQAMTADVTVSLAPDAKVTFHNDHQESNWTVTLADTGEASMTGYRVWAIQKYVKDADCFLLTYGDGVSDVDIRELLKFHKAHGRVATVTAVRPPSRFGELTTDETLRVLEFNEKSQATAGFINGGFLVFDAKRVWPYFSGSPDEVLEREPMQRLAQAGELMAFSHTGFWQPMDTPREYALLNDLWRSGNAPWKIWT